MVAAPSFGLVNLELRAATQGVGIGETVDVGLYAVSDTGLDEAFGGIEAILIWNPSHLVLQPPAIRGGSVSWFIFGFTWDSEIDGLNDSFLDGDARLEVATFDATAKPEGLLVATFRFVAAQGTPGTDLVLEPAFGTRSVTQVLAPGGAVLTGTLSGATVTIADVRRFADLQVCFTGELGFGPPAYSLDPVLQCASFDFDLDGDIDAMDHEVFVGAMSGSGE